MSIKKKIYYKPFNVFFWSPFSNKHIYKKEYTDDNINTIGEFIGASITIKDIINGNDNSDEDSVNDSDDVTTTLLSSIL